MTEQRRLAAIVSADVAGYSRLMGQDESGTLAALRRHRAELWQPKITEHGGKVVGSAGDSLLIEFASVVAAVRCAIEIQQAMTERNAAVPEERRMLLRFGINLGEVIAEDDTIYGDGVNIAARLQELAEPGGLCLSQVVLDNVRNKLETVFADGGQQALKNIVEPLRVWHWRAGATAPVSAAPVGLPALALPDKPSIAVLPFANLSGDPEQEYFADGMVEDVITALSRFRSLFVIARNSSFAYKGRAVDVRQVARELGVRYLLEGSVRRAGNRVRITGQLVDASSGSHLWADRFDGTLDDVFDLQDRVTANVVGAIAPKLDQAEIERARRKPTLNLGAYDYHLRALAKLYQLTAEATIETLQLLDAAIALDPGFAAAHALCAFCYSWRKMSGWSADRGGESAATVRHARRAVELVKDDALVLAWAGYSLAAVAGEVDDGVAMIDRAIELNPNLAVAWGTSGWMRLFRGEPDQAIEHAERAMRLSPLDPNLPSLRGVIATAHFFSGRFEDAVAWTRRALQAQPDFRPALRMAAAAEAMAGRLAQANRYRERLLQLDPALRLANLGDVMGPYRPKDFARYLEGLRKAGLPE